MSTQSPAAVRVYLARVRSALTDLPAAEVEEILEDVRPHMTEIAEEFGEDVKVEALIEKLGTPEAYAAELRAAGDYPPPSATPAPGAPGGPAKSSLFAPRLALWSLVAAVIAVGITGFAVGVELSADVLVMFVILGPVLVLSAWYVANAGLDTMTALPEVRKLRSSFGSFASGSGAKAVGYLRALQPAWWLVCAVLLVLLGLLLVVARTRGLLALPLFAAAAVAAVWFGPKTKGDKRLLWLSLPISAFVVGSALGLFGYQMDRLTNRYYGDTPSSYTTSNTTSDGKPALYYGKSNLDNIYVFDAQGKPLTDVLLYDENGRPLTVPRYGCEARSGSQMKIGEDNRFPRPLIKQGAVDEYGVYDGYNAGRAACRENAEVPFSVAIPKGTTPPSTSVTPTPPTQTPSATPTPSTTPTG
jgi:HAAS domain-containing protein